MPSFYPRLHPLLSICTTLLAASLIFLPIPTHSQATAEKRQSIRVVMDDNYPPYVFKDGQGNLQGIIIDQWRLWEEKAGISAIISGMDWAEAQRRMQAGEFDVIDTIFFNDSRDKIYDFTKPYARLDVPLFFHKDISGIHGPGDTRGFLIAVKDGDAAIDILRQHGSSNVIEYPSYEAIIAAARDGKVKVFTVDRPPALYYLNKMGIQDQFRETEPMFTGELHRAVAKGQSDLLATVEAGFARISPTEYQSIDKHWMGAPLSSHPYFKYAGYLAISLVAIGGLLLVWLFLLKRSVAGKTRELAESKKFLDSIIENLPLMIFVKNASDLTFSKINQAGEEMLGLSREQLMGKTVYDFFPTAEADLFTTKDREVLAVEGTVDTPEETVQTDRGPRLLHTRKMAIRQKNGEATHLVGISEDITERRQAEEALRHTNELFARFMQHSPVYTFIKEITETESRVLQASDNYLQMVGIRGSEMIGKTMADLFPAEFAAKITADDWRIVSKGEVLVLEEELDGRSYTTIKFPIVQGEKNILAGYTIDITERKQSEAERLKLEQQLLHTQKLESLGVLAGGIAHDFNNLLMAILGNADLALRRLNPESPAVENLQNIEQASAQAADLAKQMLAYSGKGKFVIEHLQLNRLLEEMLHMLQVSISKNAVLRVNLTPTLPTVEADATQIRQIIMNLVINASEAISEKSGIIAITTGCMDCDKEYLRNVWLEDNLTDGLYVYLEVADTGCGMTKETLNKLFDPFFSTKFTGRGLGMSAVLGIVRGHRGAIKVYSEPGKGSTFKILLPASDRPAELFNGAAPENGWTGGGSVLLVDDEETIRGIGSEMLHELGFTTLTAKDGKEALEVFKQNPGIELVILDLTMPHMDGEECFRELRRLQPGIKVIMSSGYNEQEVTQKFVGKGLAGFIQKPYRLSTLREVIQAIQG
jgi:PAS domain S-box-containing protein